jgi:hypothetical protein
MPAEFQLCKPAKVFGNRNLSEATSSRRDNQCHSCRLRNSELSHPLSVGQLPRSRDRLVSRDVHILLQAGHSGLTYAPAAAQTSNSAVIQASSAAVGSPAKTQAHPAANIGQKELKATHE